MTLVKPTAMLIIIMTFILVFASIILVNNYQRVVEHQRISNHYYSENAVTLEGEFYIDNIEQLDSKFSNRGLVLYKLVNPVQDVRVVFSSNQFIHPQLIEGRFFQKEDFFGQSNYAVVGSQILNQLESEEGTYYLTYGNLTYEVIGIIGYDQASMLDYTVFLSANLQNIKMEGLYIVDGNKKSDIQYFLENQTILKDIITIEKEYANAQRILGLRNFGSVIFLLIFSMLSFGYIVLILFWIKKSHREFFIRRMCGHRFHLIIFSFLGNLFKYNILGTVSGMGAILLYRNYHYVSYNIIFLVTLFILLFITGCNSILLVASFINKRNLPICDKIR